MKKKLLSLVLAGAMVASTSVSAFATTDTVVKEYNGTANVEMEGFIYSNAGDAPSGTISVSIPTSLQFQVSNEGKLTGTSINVVNNGLDEVEIVADKFLDHNPSGGITVKTQQELQGGSYDRSNVVLWIQGKGEEIAYFKSDENDKNGIYNEEGENQSQGITISKLSGKSGSSNSDQLQLKGYAGTDSLSGLNAISDQFTLRLKVKKPTP